MLIYYILYIPEDSFSRGLSKPSNTPCCMLHYKAGRGTNDISFQKKAMAPVILP